MPTNPRMIRAADQDRDRVAAQLREHHAVGRLDPEEFQERLDKVYQAKTMGELDDLVADLPAIDPYPLPAASLQRHPPGTGPTAASTAGSVLDAMSRGRGRFSPAWQAAWGSWFTVTLVCIVVWLLGGGGYPWPLWVALPWGAVMAGRWITGTGPQDHRGNRHQLRHHRDEIGGPQDNG